MKKKPLWLGVMATSLTLVLAACGSSSSSASKTQTINRMSKDVIATMDPQMATDAISGQVLQDTGAGLLRYDGKKLQADVAKSLPKVSKDKKTYTYTLRPGTKWSDGKTVTAKDFVYSWRRLVDPKTKSEYAYIASGIKNADAITAGKKAPSTLGVKATGKYTFQVTLERVMPYFNKMITLQVFNPVEKSTVDKYGKKFATSSKTLTFNGPYTLSKWNGSSNTWTETKNPKYWNAKNVHVGKIKTQVVKDTTTALNLYQDGKLDDAVISGDTASQMRNNADYNTVEQGRTTYLEMNAKRVPALGNEKIREAMSLAINRKEFIKKVLGDGSKPISQVVPEGLFSNDKTGEDFATAASKKYASESDYDVKKATKLYKEGLKELGTDHVQFTLLGDDTDVAKKTSEYLIGAWTKALPGIKVTNKSVPFKTRVQLSLDHQADVVVSSWQADFPDAISFLDLFTTGNSYNMGEWSSAKYDADIKASKTTDAADVQKRWDDLKDADETLAGQQGVIGLYQTGEAHLTKKTIKHMPYSPGNMINFVGTTNKAK
ncbi:peptide ABC transporter substrate-binding protein [Lacticaseibacillus zhaodongensis]|uniref:peptide ABC transporter substrate-binding protein n=1 Tax=Lacticaseibacillus zhaodongensis TaxID=2668065 RepID=UPI0012D35588|nr:peptide ABC transporter substrate-binding protein [Lacticaseibacillus zhaodongensis]